MNPGPFIVLEGPDGVGKTTLANAIQKMTGWPIIHSGPPERLAWEEWIGKTLVDGPAIFDRLHLGSIAYAGVFRNMYDVTDHENWMVEGWLMSRGCILVYCDVPREVQDRNLSRGPTDPDAQIYEAREKRDAVRRLYQDYFAGALDVKPNIEPVYYDYTKNNMAAMARWIIALASRQLDDDDRNLLPSVIAAGSIVMPRRIFIGDEPNDLTKLRARARKRGLDEARAIRLGFALNRAVHHNTFAGGSGRYLHLCLRMAGIELKNTLIFNSLTWDGKNVLEVLDPGRLFPGAEIIALGNKAETRALKAGWWVDRKIPHPQYARRFFYKYQHEYAEMLRGDRKEYSNVAMDNARAL